jgi:hypothetical protein
MLGGMRRPAGGASGGGGSSGEFSIMFVNGPIKFQSEEGVLYARLFHIVRRSDRRRGQVVLAGFALGLPLTARWLCRSTPTATDTSAGRKARRSSAARA